MHNWLIPAGGITAGTGIVFLLFGFEADTGQDFASSFSEIGYSGITSFGPNTAGWIGMALVFIGIAMLIAGNRTAWSRTDGY